MKETNDDAKCQYVYPAHHSVLGPNICNVPRKFHGEALARGDYAHYFAERPSEPNCLQCGEPQPHEGAHFDGTYFICDPEAPMNTDPNYDPEKDGNRG